MLSIVSTADDRYALMLRALGHPVRLRIVRRIAAEVEVRACDFAEDFSLRQPTISGHLKVLREAGLVTTRRCGTQICYSLRPAALTDLVDLLIDQLPAEAAPTAAFGPTRQGELAVIGSDGAPSQ